MKRDRLDLAFQHCADLNLMVDWEDLGGTTHGHYDWRRDRIVLDRRLTASQATATIGHELGHRRFGDTCSTPALERRAWEYGAAMLVSPAEYRLAEAMVGHHIGALAIELDVTPKLIDAWRRWWRTKGEGAVKFQHTSHCEPMEPAQPGTT